MPLLGNGVIIELGHLSVLLKIWFKKFGHFQISNPNTFYLKYGLQNSDTFKYPSQITQLGY